jgi:hypothetical protein
MTEWKEGNLYRIKVFLNMHPATMHLCNTAKNLLNTKCYDWANPAQPKIAYHSSYFQAWWGCIMLLVYLSSERTIEVLG